MKEKEKLIKILLALICATLFPLIYILGRTVIYLLNL